MKPMRNVLADAFRLRPSRRVNPRAALAPIIALLLVSLFAAGCKHVQTLDTKPLDASGMSYDTIKKLESLKITAPEISELVRARNAGFSDASCIELFRIAHGRGEAFASGESVAGLIRVGMTEPSVLELARLNQLGLGSGELQAIRLTGLSDSIVLEVARHRAAGKPEFSAATPGPRSYWIFLVPYFLPFASPAGPVESLYLGSHDTPLGPSSSCRNGFFCFGQLRLHGFADARLSNREGITRGAICRRAISRARNSR
jgi:hypothetical protein